MSVSFDSVAVGEALPALIKIATREDIAAYAYASGDTNPLHLSEEAASERGFDGVIGHGMFTMAHLTTCLTNWLDDPRALLHVKANFRAAVQPGDEMVAGGRIVSLDPERRRAKLEAWVTVDRNGVTEHAVRRGSAEVQLS
jgi:acyl dehydratase